MKKSLQRVLSLLIAVIMVLMPVGEITHAAGQVDGASQNENGFVLPLDEMDKGENPIAQLSPENPAMYDDGTNSDRAAGTTGSAIKDWWNRITKKDNTNSGNLDGRDPGLKPSPMIYEYGDYDISDRSFSAQYAPRTYDLRETGRLTPMRDQGANGSCWAFACYGALESYLRPQGEFDFSEKHMRNTHGFDWGWRDGGTREISAAYLARWSGPVWEKDDPYDDRSGYSPENLPRAMDLVEAWYLPSTENGRNSNSMNIFKNQLMQDGGVATIINGGNYPAHYDPSDNANHAVVIVGWDDNYSRRNFGYYAPPGDGAWIVRNSWGRNWGRDGGYFMVSYYDGALGSQGTVYKTVRPGHSDNIYQYDPFGMNSSLTASQSQYAANVFGPTRQAETINRVGFFANGGNSSYEVYVVKDAKQGLNDRVKVATGTFTYPGYHTIDFGGVVIPAGNYFAVIVKIDTNSRYGIGIERPYMPSSRASAQRGQSYYSSNGTTWRDITSDYSNTNICIKAFTKNGSNPGPTPPNPDPGPTPPNPDPNPNPGPGDVSVSGVRLNKSTLNMTKGASERLVATVLPENATNKSVTWRTSNPYVASVDSTGNVTARGKGSAKITVVTNDGGKFAECMVNVSDGNSPSSDGLNVTVVPERTSYQRGEYARINVTVTKPDGSAASYADLEINMIANSGSNGNLTGRTDYYGRFSFDAMISETAALGQVTCQVKAYLNGYQDGIGTGQFNIVDPNQNTASVKINLDKSTYKEGDYVNVNAKVTEQRGYALQYATVTLVLKSKDGEVLLNKSGYTNNNGVYPLNFRIMRAGEYILEASVSARGYVPVNDSVKVIVTGDAPEPPTPNPPEPPKPSNEEFRIEINMDKTTYAPGETADVTVRIKDKDYRNIADSDLTVSVKDAEGDVKTVNGKTNSLGSFQFKYQVNSNAKEGNFVISITAAKQGFTTKTETKNFSVAAKSDPKQIVIELEKIVEGSGTNKKARVIARVKNGNGAILRYVKVNFNVMIPDGMKQSLNKYTDRNGECSILISPNNQSQIGLYKINASTSIWGYKKGESNIDVNLGNEEPVPPAPNPIPDNDNPYNLKLMTYEQRKARGDFKHLDNELAYENKYAKQILETYYGRNFLDWEGLTTIDGDKPVKITDFHIKEGKPVLLGMAAQG